LNSIIGKVGLNTQPEVLISLIQSCSVPILLYGTEASVEHAYSLAFMKVFKTYDKDVVTECQFYMGKLPMEMEIGVRALSAFMGYRQKS